MLRHKRSLHKYSRARLESEYMDNLKSLFQGVALVVEMNGSQCMCLMSDGSIEYYKLPSDHPKVVEYKGLVKKGVSCEFIEDVTAWMKE